VYVNGELSASDSSGSLGGASGVDTAGDLIISSSGADFFPGAMDDVQIFNYAKDAVGIAYLYTDVRIGETICADPTNPILAAYDLDGDCEIGLGDLIELASHWLDAQLVPGLPRP